MANPFKDAERRKKVAPGGKQEILEQAETLVTPEPPLDPIVEKEEGRVEPPKNVATDDPLAAVSKPKPAGKAYNVYLDAKAVEKLERLEKKYKLNRSKIISTLIINYDE